MYAHSEAPIHCCTETIQPTQRREIREASPTPSIRFRFGPQPCPQCSQTGSKGWVWSRARESPSRRLQRWRSADASHQGALAVRVQPTHPIGMTRHREEERFVQLEVKLAYLEKTSQELSEVLHSQTRLLDELHKRLDQLERHVRQATEPREFPHEKPPHY